MPDHLLMEIVLHNLPSNYDTLRTVLDTDDDLTYETLKMRISAFFRRHIQGSSSSGGQAKAFPVREHDGGKSKKVCFGCGEIGHFKSDCPRLKAGKPKVDQAAGRKEKAPYKSKAKSDGKSNGEARGDGEEVLPSLSNYGYAFTAIGRRGIADNKWLVDFQDAHLTWVDP